MTRPSQRLPHQTVKGPSTLDRQADHARCLVRLWSVEPGVIPDNRGSSRTPIEQVTGRLGSSADRCPVAYNDEVTGSSPVTPTRPRQFTAFLQPHGRQLTEATRADLEAFIANLLGRWLPATAATRDQQLQALDRWLEDEEEIPVNPMARLKPPIVPDKPIPVVPMLDIGARRGGEAGLRVADLAFDLDVVLVLGKGRRERALPFGRTTAVALDR
jgi:hypothetical protein